MAKFKVVHYLNQFFGQIGGEEKAGTAPLKKDGAVGPGMALNGAFKGEAEVGWYSYLRRQLFRREYGICSRPNY